MRVWIWIKNCLISDRMTNEDSSICKFMGVSFPNPDVINAQVGSKLFERPEFVYNLDCRDDDIFVVAYPKCGITWTREIVWLITHDPDVKKTDQRILEVRAPEIGVWWPGEVYTPLTEMTSPRVFKTHFPWTCFPWQAKEKKCKIVYCSRNIKDASVSWFHMWRKANIPVLKVADVNDQLQMFSNPEMIWADYFSHNIGYWEQRNNGHLLFLFYEDMVKEPVKSIKKIADFLEYELNDEQLMKILAATSFDRMKTDASVNWEFLKTIGLQTPDADPFIRKGTVGDWKNHLSEPMNSYAHDLCREKLEAIGLRHTYEL